MKYPVALKVLPALLVLSACYQPQLLGGLSEQQANEIVAVLQGHNLSADKQDQGKMKFAVAVGQTDFPAAVDLVQKYDLPTPARVEVAHVFPADTFVGSPMAEQSRLLSAVEQRLEQNLAAMNNVARARVQVSYPLKPGDEDGKGERAMHVAVLLTYRNAANRDLLVSEVKRFIKNSFSNIDYDNISVILYEAPSISGMLIAQPATSSENTWLYPLLAIPAVIGTAGGGLILFLRRRRQAPDVSEPDSDSRAPQAGEIELTPSNKASAPLRQKTTKPQAAAPSRNEEVREVTP